jgi:hypothetical protein
MDEVRLFFIKDTSELACGVLVSFSIHLIKVAEIRGDSESTNAKTSMIVRGGRLSWGRHDNICAHRLYLAC